MIKVLNSIQGKGTCNSSWYLSNGIMILVINSRVFTNAMY